MWTFTIVTTDACSSFSWLHDRQPVMLFTQEALNLWLDTSAQSWTPELTGLVQPYNEKVYHLDWYATLVSFYGRSGSNSISYQVPKEVGRVGNESPSFIQPVKERKDGIQAMFQKQIQTAAKRKRTESPPPTSTPAGATTEAKTVQERDQQKKIKNNTPSTPPPSPRKRAKKASTPQKSSAVPEKGKITSFFRKT